MKNFLNMNRWKDEPIFTYLFVGINLFIYLLMILLHGTSENMRTLLEWGANFRPIIVLGQQYWRFLTAGFLHIGLEHIAFNMLSLYFLGQELENMVGHWRFVVIYLISIIGGNLVSFAFAPVGVMSAGASTGIFGLFASYIGLSYLYPNSAYLRHRGQSFLMLIVINLVFNLISQGVDIYGHIGGAVFGATSMAIIGLKVQSPISKWHRLFIGIILIAVSFILLIVGNNKGIM